MPPFLSTSSKKEYRDTFVFFRSISNETQAVVRHLSKSITAYSQHRILDIGAADGQIIAALMPHFSEGYAVEPRIDFAKKLTQINDLKVYNSKWEDLELQLAFDRILLVHSIEYIPLNSWPREIRRMLDVLTPSGIINVVMNKANSGFMELMDYVNRDDPKHITSQQRINVLNEVLPLAGAAVHDISNIQIAVRIRSLEDFIKCCVFHLEADRHTIEKNWFYIERFAKERTNNFATDFIFELTCYWLSHAHAVDFADNKHGATRKTTSSLHLEHHRNS